MVSSIYNKYYYEFNGQNGPKINNNNGVNSVWDRININGEIEPTVQSKITGDCWLLTDLNTLSSTSWGKKMIKDAIKRNSVDGGVDITLKGAEFGAPKNYHITIDEIVEARESGKYSTGDDDVIAFELAFEKYLKITEEQYGREKGSGINGGLGLDEVTRLLAGTEPAYHYYGANDNADKNIEEFSRILDEIEKNPGKYAVEVGFKYTMAGNDFNMKQEHAYQIKKVITKNGKKYVILTNPWDSSKEIKMSAEYFCSCASVITLIEPLGNKSNPNLRSNLEIELDAINKSNKILKTLKNEPTEKGSKLEFYGLEKEISNINGSVVKALGKDSVLHIVKIIGICEKRMDKRQKNNILRLVIDAVCEYANSIKVPKDIISKNKNELYEILNKGYIADSNFSDLIDELMTKPKGMFNINFSNISWGT